MLSNGLSVQTKLDKNSITKKECVTLSFFWKMVYKESLTLELASVVYSPSAKQRKCKILQTPFYQESI